MRIKETGMYVRIKYTVRLSSGEILKGDPKEGLEHMDFFTGFEQVLPGLESRLVGLAEGDEVTLTIPPEEAFGVYDPALVKEKSFSEFPEGKDFETGKWVEAKNEDYKINHLYYVKAKSAESITLDYNHPLANKTLIYQLKIVEARPATMFEFRLRNRL